MIRKLMRKALRNKVCTFMLRCDMCLTAAPLSQHSLFYERDTRGSQDGKQFIIATILRNWPENKCLESPY